MAMVTMNIHGARVEAGGSNGAIWLDVMEPGEHLSLPRLTVFLDRANVRPLQRQLGAIAAELASMNDGLEAASRTSRRWSSRDDASYRATQP
jgi:hypothetical protein